MDPQQTEVLTCPLAVPYLGPINSTSRAKRNARLTPSAPSAGRRKPSVAAGPPGRNRTSAAPSPRGRRAVGLFGGTFDPPHRGHLFAAGEALRRLRLKRVVFIPSANPPHKREGPLASPRDRLKMVRLAVRSRSRFRVSPVEIARRGPSFTFDTVRAMRRRFPGTDMYFIIGADTVRELGTWYRYRDLLEEVRFAAVTRPGHSLGRGNAALRGRLVLLRTKGMNVSSTALREQLRRGVLPPAIPPVVRSYIRKRGLYLRR